MSLDELRNDAVAAWIKTYPDDSRLDHFLEGVDPAARDDLRHSARAICEAASRFLEANAGVERIDLDQFHPALHAHLIKRFPWMREGAFAALRSFTSWSVSHEGY